MGIAYFIGVVDLGLGLPCSSHRCLGVPASTSDLRRPQRRQNLASTVKSAPQAQRICAGESGRYARYGGSDEVGESGSCSVVFSPFVL